MVHQDAQPRVRPGGEVGDDGRQVVHALQVLHDHALDAQVVAPHLLDQLGVVPPLDVDPPGAGHARAGAGHGDRAGRRARGTHRAGGGPDQGHRASLQQEAAGFEREHPALAEAVLQRHRARLAADHRAAEAGPRLLHHQARFGGDLRHRLRLLPRRGQIGGVLAHSPDDRSIAPSVISATRRDGPPARPAGRGRTPRPPPRRDRARTVRPRHRGRGAGRGRRASAPARRRDPPGAPRTPRPGRRRRRPPGRPVPGPPDRAPCAGAEVGQQHLPAAAQVERPLAAHLVAHRHQRVGRLLRPARVQPVGDRVGAQPVPAGGGAEDGVHAHRAVHLRAREGGGAEDVVEVRMGQREMRHTVTRERLRLGAQPRALAEARPGVDEQRRAPADDEPAVQSHTGSRHRPTPAATLSHPSSSQVTVIPRR